MLMQKLLILLGFYILTSPSTSLYVTPQFEQLYPPSQLEPSFAVCESSECQKAGKTYLY